MINNFGAFLGREAHIYEISNEYLRVGIADLGASVQYVKVNRGAWVDVCPGFDNAEAYVASGTYFGATIGRVANRIECAKFSLGGREYSVPANDGKNCNHGGTAGFDRQFFTVRTKGAENTDWHGDMLELTLSSPDGDMGFPGKLNLIVRYKLRSSALEIFYGAESDKTTLFAPTCHLYFNLDGAKEGGPCGNSCGNMLKINAESYTPIGEGLIPTGGIAPVCGTPFDFTDFHAIGERIGADGVQLRIAGGYDHNFVLNGEHAATAYSNISGIKLDIFTDMPGLQLYSGNFLKGRSRFGELEPRAAYALEPQFFPNSANMPQFEQPTLQAGKRCGHYIRYEFGEI